MTRLLFATGRSTHTNVRDLIQGILVSELLSPSPEIWLTSPWITDIAVLDNRSDEFTSLVPEWGATPIRLTQVLAQLAADGSEIYMLTRPDEHGNRWRESVGNAGRQRACLDRLHVRMDIDLHEKGILASHSYLSGSMNFTYRGIHVNDEQLRFDTAPAILAEAKLAFRHSWLSQAASGA